MYCNCRCHRSNGVMVHCFPCCSTCRYCGAHITHNHINDHIKKHEEEFSKISNSPIGSGELPLRKVLR